MNSFDIGTTYLILSTFILLSAIDAWLLGSSLFKGAGMNMVAWVASAGSSLILMIPFISGTDPNAIGLLESISVFLMIARATIAIAIAILVKLWILQSRWRQQLSRQRVFNLALASALIPGLSLVVYLALGTPR